MDASKLTKLGKLAVKSGEDAVRLLFSRVSEKIDSYKDLTETEHAFLTFGLDVYEFYEKNGEIPKELEEQFLDLKRRIDNMEEE